MSGPTLSVLMPARNSQAWLPFAMASALASDLQDLELIVVDDGSDTYGVKNCVMAFHLRDPRVRYRRIEWNGVDSDEAGLAAALDMARGEFCVGMGSDDLVQPWLWPVEVAVLRARHVAIVYSDILLAPAEIDGGWLSSLGQQTHDALHDWDPRLLDRKNIVPDVAMTRTSIRRELVRRSDANGCVRHMHGVWKYAAASGLRAVRIPQAGYIYVTHQDSVSNRAEDVLGSVLRAQSVA